MVGLQGCVLASGASKPRTIWRVSKMSVEIHYGDSRLPDRFWDKTTPVTDTSRYVDSPCWLWTGSVTRVGYARLGFPGRPDAAHRTAYEYCAGPIGADLDIDHLCRVRSCVNPNHLEPKTRRDNLRQYMLQDGVKYGATHCKHGHEFTEANTHVDKLNRRRCKACDRERHRVAYAARGRRSNE